MTTATVVLIFGPTSVERVPVVMVITSSPIPCMQTYWTARSVTTSIESVSNASHQGSLLGCCHRREVVL